MERVDDGVRSLMVVVYAVSALAALVVLVVASLFFGGLPHVSPTVLI